ncbi:MAG: hypothetical protein K6F15_06990 [Treponema sp.]|nr:hypothetical protein [Treponema sp.]
MSVKAAVNALDDKGETPLSIVLDYATDYEESFLIDICDYLIENGADINLFGFNSTDCFTCAHFADKRGVIEYLFKHAARKVLNCFVTDLNDSFQWYVQNASMITSFQIALLVMIMMKTVKEKSIFSKNIEFSFLLKAGMKKKIRMGIK